MKANHIPCARHLPQSGFSLIEVMIAILITLFMSTALMYIFIGMRNSYKTQTQLVLLQDSERLVQTMSANVIQQAGYYVAPDTITAAAALPASNITWPNGTQGTFAAGQPIAGLGNGSGSGANSDAFSVRYQTASQDGLLNCNGGTNKTGINTMYVNTFSVNAANELTCSVGNAAAIPLASNVGKLTVSYGTDSANAGNVNGYLDANTITSAALWGKVYTVMISITFLDPTKSTATTPVLMPNPLVLVINLEGKQ
jgi:type IV pilus assembly protein PilW